MTAKLWAVVKREYVERVRTKGFVIGTILGPLLMGGMMVVPLLAMRSGSKPLKVAVLDRTGTLRPAVEDALRAARFDGKVRFDVQPGDESAPGAREAGLKKAVLEGKIDGYLELPDDAVAKGTASYFGRNVSNRLDLRTMERAVSGVVVGLRLAEAGLDPVKVKDLTRELDLKTIRLSEKRRAGGPGGGDALLDHPAHDPLHEHPPLGERGHDVRHRREDEPGGRGDGGGGLVDDAPGREAPGGRGRGAHAVPRVGDLDVRGSRSSAPVSRWARSRCPRSRR